MQKLKLGGRSYTHHRISIPIERLDILEWLELQSLYPKVYWESREGKRSFAGIGEALALKEVPRFSAEEKSPVRFYGGISFSDALWEEFPQCYFFLPLFEIEQREEETHLILNLIDENPLPEGMIQNLCFDRSSASCTTILKQLSRVNLPEQSDWEREIVSYLKMIEKKELEKIVYARCSTFSFDSRVPALHLLRKLKQQTQRTTLFAFEMSPSASFIGATPEKLYERKGDFIVSDVMASTRPKGNTEEEDWLNRRELLHNPKERREFDFVKNFIREALEPRCLFLNEELEDRIVTTTSVHHLYNRFSGRLKSEVTDADLIAALHPTPAMGGQPREKALSLLAEKEPFVRGWYAAPIGWITPQEADLCVGIRSALVQGSEVHLFSGTGIVEGSDPTQEWEELEYKISPFRRLFV